MVLNAKREILLNSDFSPQFSAALIHKDLHYLQDLAKSLRKTRFPRQPGQGTLRDDF